MKISILLLRGSGWTIAAIGASQLLRFATNVVLARILAPELFGIMAIVNSVRMGIALVTDAGIGQNIIVNPNAEVADFYNTAWSINLVRALLLLTLCEIIAAPLARFYSIDALMSIFPVAGFLFLFEGATSMARPIVQKRLQFAKLNIFDVIMDVMGYCSIVVFVVISPTIWGLLFGVIFGSAIKMIGSYLLLPKIRHRFFISKQYAREIFGFSKWIFISSIAYFFATNSDRLYLAKVISLDLLGVYGIARAMSEPVIMLVTRLGGVIIFPSIASYVNLPRQQLREQFAHIRLIFLLLTAVGLSIFAATADLLIVFFYDQRYQAATWMAPLLITGTWFSIITNLSESALMGFGKPSYGALANALKLGWLLMGLPLGFAAYGLLGAVVVIAVSDLFRYVPIFAGQVRVHFSFGMQDLTATLLFFGLIGLWESLRFVSGVKTPFDEFPIAKWF